ncbi:unnamed protein product [Pedinophyceae sp. YPF-701]|nr:unnamed protein product [Pedinophyceae sp. YPF-701]
MVRASLARRLFGVGQAARHQFPEVGNDGYIFQFASQKALSGWSTYTDREAFGGGSTASIEHVGGAAAGQALPNSQPTSQPAPTDAVAEAGDSVSGFMRFSGVFSTEIPPTALDRGVTRSGIALCAWRVPNSDMVLDLTTKSETAYGSLVFRLRGDGKPYNVIARTRSSFMLRGDDFSEAHRWVAPLLPQPGEGGAGGAAEEGDGGLGSLGRRKPMFQHQREGWTDVVVPLSSFVMHSPHGREVVGQEDGTLHDCKDKILSLGICVAPVDHAAGPFSLDVASIRVTSEGIGAWGLPEEEARRQRTFRSMGL